MNVTFKSKKKQKLIFTNIRPTNNNKMTFMDFTSFSYLSVHLRLTIN